MKGLLSIIVPVYRVEPYLVECIDSILAQTFSHFELILVDDGSPDNCPAICDKYAQQDTRIRVIHQDNAGLSAARNTGIDQAQGEWIGFVDSDDWISPHYFEAGINIMRQHPEVDVVELPMNRFYNTLHARRYAPKEQKVATTSDTIFALWFAHQGYDNAFAQTKLYRREIFNILRFPERVIFEDVHNISNVLTRSRGWAYANDERATYYYRWHPGSITAKAKSRDMLSLLQAQSVIAQQATRCDLIPRWQKQLYALYLINRFIDYRHACRIERCDFTPPLPILSFLKTFTPGVMDLFRLPISWRSRLKYMIIKP